jgi:polar amino acid transport system substrate-binding protein
MKLKNKTAFALSAVAILFLSACSSGSTEEAAPSEETTSASTCTKDNLETVTPGQLTIATGEPAYYPWVIDDKPESGEGFEAAVAYAVATQLGYSNEEVVWKRTTFDGAIAPGVKDYDFNLQQFSITPERKDVVDFSSPYYTASQVIVSFKGSAIDGKTSIAELKSAKIGAAVGTTSLEAAQTIIAPDTEVQVFNDNATAVQALKNKQIDGIVVDLPTGYYLAGVEVEGGLLVGQLPSSGTGDQFGLLLTKDSPITGCISEAVDAITSDGTLAAIEEKWLTAGAGVPVLN